jgi:hypothetical protein
VDDLGEAGVCACYKTKNTEYYKEGVSTQHAVETAGAADTVPEGGCFYDGGEGDAECSQTQGAEKRDEQLQVRNRHCQKDCKQGGMEN